MRKIDSFEDEMDGVVTYEIRGGKRVTLDARAVREYGAATLLRDCGLGDQLPTERLPVTQSGRVVGTVPPDFDPSNSRSKSFFYDFRRGDFVREGDGWTASKALGFGDLAAVPGFVFEPPFSSHGFVARRV